MNNRIRAFHIVRVPVLLSTSVLLAFGQSARLQTAILPAVPLVDASSSRFDAPPAVPSKTYLEAVPSLLRGDSAITNRTSPAAAILERAEAQFEAGRQAYQANDTAAARQSFDEAVDLMLEASSSDTDGLPDLDARLERMVDAIHKMDVAGMGASSDPEEGKYEKAPLEDILQLTFPVDPKLKNRVRTELTETASQLPLSVTDAVLGYINYFATRGRRTLVAGMERSGRYRPMIQRVLAEEGVPQELIHLAQAESGFMPRAMSRAAAGGMWQFLKWRGQEYGLEQTAYADDRLDPEKATRAAAHHLHDLYKHFGDWYLAIAAYNCGPQAVEAAVERTGYADFWELRNRGALPAETTAYVPIILAMTIMEKNAAEYGLENVELDAPIQYDTVQVTAPTNLALVSDIADTTLPELLELNPAVLHNVAPQNWTVRVPKGTGERVMATLAMVPAERRTAWRMHRVAPGETLADIGKRFGVAPAGLLAANHLAAGEPAEGNLLMIPAMAQAAPVRSRPVATTAWHARYTAAYTPHTKAHAAAPTGIAPKPASKSRVLVAHSSVR